MNTISSRWVWNRCKSGTWTISYSWVGSLQVNVSSYHGNTGALYTTPELRNVNNNVIYCVYSDSDVEYQQTAHNVQLWTCTPSTHKVPWWVSMRIVWVSTTSMMGMSWRGLTRTLQDKREEEEDRARVRFCLHTDTMTIGSLIPSELYTKHPIPRCSWWSCDTHHWVLNQSCD